MSFPTVRHRFRRHGISLAKKTLAKKKKKKIRKLDKLRK
jgi:hypothetical protein